MHPEAEDSIELVVTYYALAKLTYDERRAIMNRCRPVLIDWLKRHNNELVICGYEIRLIKKNTIRSRALLHKEYLSRLNLVAERALRLIWTEYSNAEVKFRAAECTVKSYGRFLLPRLKHNGGVEVIGGFELTLVKENTIRVKIVGPIEYPKAFRPGG